MQPLPREPQLLVRCFLCTSWAVDGAGAAMTRMNRSNKLVLNPASHSFMMDQAAAAGLVSCVDEWVQAEEVGREAEALPIAHVLGVKCM